MAHQRARRRLRHASVLERGVGGVGGPLEVRGGEEEAEGVLGQGQRRRACFGFGLGLGLGVELQGQGQG